MKKLSSEPQVNSSTAELHLPDGSVIEQNPKQVHKVAERAGQLSISTAVEVDDDFDNSPTGVMSFERRASILPEAPTEVAELLALNHEIKDLDDLSEVAAALVGVPMLDRDDIELNIVRESKGSIVHRDVTIPMNRIVGIGTFQTWAGRGFNEDGTLAIKNRGSSLAEVAKCAKLGQINEYIRHSGSPRLTLFEDSEGEVWAQVRLEGSHRVAGAKARGDQYLRHATIDDAEVIDKVDFSVREVLTERHAKQEGWSAYASELVRVSELVDSESNTTDRNYNKIPGSPMLDFEV